jgi:hypothetical protein
MIPITNYFHFTITSIMNKENGYLMYYHFTLISLMCFKNLEH